MILDGYTQLGKVWSKWFSYRPALAPEREIVQQELRFFQIREYLLDFVKRHVVWINSLEMSDEELRLVFFVCAGVAPPENDNGWRKNWEAKDAENLMSGVVLELTNPMFARRKCDDCKAWWYDNETGRIVRRAGKPLKRPEGMLLLCQTHEGCPKGTPDNQKSLSPKNRLAWTSYQEWKAVGEFPDDPIVRRNADIIQKAIRTADGLRANRQRHG